MSIERGDSQPPIEENPIYQTTKNNFDIGYKLDIDAINVWIRLGSVETLKKIGDKYLPTLPPLPHYEEYIREANLRNAKTDKGRAHGEAFITLIMERSDPEAIAAFDKLVDEFNADFERMKREKDYQAMEDFARRGDALTQSKK